MNRSRKEETFIINLNYYFKIHPSFTVQLYPVTSAPSTINQLSHLYHIRSTAAPPSPMSLMPGERITHCNSSCAEMKLMLHVIFHNRKKTRPTKQQQQPQPKKHRYHSLGNQDLTIAYQDLPFITCYNL